MTKIFNFALEIFCVAIIPNLVPRDHEDTANLFITFINPKNLSKKASYVFRSNEDQKLHTLPNIVRVVKSRRMRWAGHVARMAEDRGVHRVLVGKPEGKVHWRDQDVDGRIILRWIFRKLEEVVGTGWSWLRIGTGGGHLWVG